MNTIYSIVNGEILRTVWGDVFGQMEFMEGFIPGQFNSDDFYVEDGVAVERPALPILSPVVLAVGEAVSLDLPIGTAVRVEDLSVTADDLPTELSFEEPGEYRLRIRPPFPTKPLIVIVQVA